MVKVLQEHEQSSSYILSKCDQDQTPHTHIINTMYFLFYSNGQTFYCGQQEVCCMLYGVCFLLCAVHCISYLLHVSLQCIIVLLCVFPIVFLRSDLLLWPIGSMLYVVCCVLCIVYHIFHLLRASLHCIIVLLCAYFLLYSDGQTFYCGQYEE